MTLPIKPPGIRNSDNLDEQFDLHSRFELLSRIASLYYLQEKTQDEIAKEFGLSRQKVQRLLKQAREQRIVEIHVHAVPVYHLHLETKLKEIFGLRDALVAPYHPDDQRRRISVARAAAGYLERQVNHHECKIAVGLGRNAYEVACHFSPARSIDCTFISAMGGSSQTGNQYNPNQICTRFATHPGAQAHLLYAPAYVKDQALRDMLLAQDAVKSTLDLARQADIAVMGVGTASDDSILIQAGCQTVEEVRRLHANGAVGEILGNYFDQNGQKVLSDLDGRVISLSMEELKRVPLVIAVASEPHKPMAVFGALRTQAINTLVVDCRLAIAVLRLAGVQDLDEDHDLFEKL